MIKLNNNFFKTNIRLGVNAQNFFDLILERSALPEEMDDYINEFEKNIKMEAINILKMESVDEIIKLFRKRINPLTEPIIVAKALEYETEIADRLFEKYIKSGNKFFCEMMLHFLINSDKNYTEKLVNILDEIRNPYALSAACIALGFISDESNITKLYCLYEDFKENYPEETYEQGPLIAMNRIMNRASLRSYIIKV